MSDSINVSVLIEEYITLRDSKKIEKSKYEAAVKVIDDRMDAIEAELDDICKRTGLDSFSCHGVGTAYKSTVRHVNVLAGEGFEKLFNYAVANNAPHLIAKHPSKNAILELLDNDPSITPDVIGVDIYTESKIQIRR